MNLCSSLILINLDSNFFFCLVSNVGERPLGLKQSPEKGKTEKMRGSLSRKGDQIKFVDVRFKR